MQTIIITLNNGKKEEYVKGIKVKEILNKMSKEEREDEIFHSGTGRIAIMKMNPMSLYESGDSTGDVSIEEMFSGNVYRERLYLYTIQSPTGWIVCQ